MDENYLVIDKGNTAYKWAIIQGDSVVLETGRSKEVVVDEWEALWKPYEVKYCVIGVVGKLDKDFYSWLVDKYEVIEFSVDLHLPIEMGYLTPKTLGVDRLAVAVAGSKRYSDQAILCIDIGTCMTFDYVTKEGVYKGGAISPGIQTRLKAMYFFTKGLPEIDLADFYDAEVSLIGRNTHESVLSGAVNGVRCEIIGQIKEYEEIAPNIQVMLTGGEAKMVLPFENELKNRIFVDEFLVMIGMYEGVRYHQSKRG